MNPDSAGPGKSSPPQSAVPPAPSSGKRRITAIVACVLLAGSVALLLYHAWDNLSPGRFDAVRMNAIVEAVRRHQVGEAEIAFRMEDISRPETLYPIPEPRQTYGHVWAQRRNGALQVAIMTRNSGHLGEYGFVFSEVPVTAWEDYPIYYSVPGPMKELGGKIDDHWWKAANRER